MCRTWMGYCPIELKAGLGAGLGTGRVGGARGTQARRRRHGRTSAGRAAGGHALQAGGTGARQAGTWARQAREARPAGRPRRGLGVLLGQWAVHLVHSTCFDPV